MKSPFHHLVRQGTTRGEGKYAGPHGPDDWRDAPASDVCRWEPELRHIAVEWATKTGGRLVRRPGTVEEARGYAAPPVVSREAPVPPTPGAADAENTKRASEPCAHLFPSGYSFGVHGKVDWCPDRGAICERNGEPWHLPKSALNHDGNLAEARRQLVDTVGAVNRQNETLRALHEILGGGGLDIVETARILAKSAADAATARDGEPWCAHCSVRMSRGNGGCPDSPQGAHSWKTTSGPVAPSNLDPADVAANIRFAREVFADESRGLPAYVRNLIGTLAALLEATEDQSTRRLQSLNDLAVVESSAQGDLRESQKTILDLQARLATIRTLAARPEDT